MTGEAPARRRDPLLTAAKALATLLIVVLAFIALAMPAAIAALFLHPEVVFAEIGSQAADVRSVTWAIASLLAGFIGFAGLGIAFLVLLRRMIDSVGAGDPFTMTNARRLARMGWLTVAVQALALLLGGVARYIQAQFPAKDYDLDVNLSLEGVLVALLLFILARVFARGAEMQDELEATI